MGRAVIRQQPQLAACAVLIAPCPMRRVAVWPQPLHGETWVVFEGEALPRWWPGDEPVAFRDLGALAVWLDRPEPG